jgi:hypothetical protein
MQYTFQQQSMVQSRRDQDRGKTFVIFDQLHEISSLKSMTNQRGDVRRGIQPRFMY